MARPVAQPVDVALRDGSTVHVREVEAGDVDGAARAAGRDVGELALAALPVRGRRTSTARRETAAEPGDGVSLVVTAGSPERVVAHAMYLKESPARAEVAFEVADDWHGRGIATILLAHLAGAAARDGVTTFVAYVHPSNRRMIGVFRESGFPVEVHASAGELEVVMPAALGEAARRRFEDRGRAAAAAAVAHVLRPASVLLVTVGGTAAGATLMRNLRDAGYRGELKVAVTPVPTARCRRPSSPCSPSRPTTCSSRRGRAARPACARWSCSRAASWTTTAGGSGSCSPSAGAAGCGSSGPARSACSTPTRRCGSTPPPRRSPRRPGRWRSRRRAARLGVAAMAEAARRGVGLSSFVSTGDKADLSGNDFLQYWEGDDATRVVMLYLESFGNPRRFGTIARRVATAKPIVAVKSGRRAADAGDAEPTRTRALLGASDVSVDALFEHAGVIRTDTVFEQLDVAALLASQPLPAGRRVGIVSNGRGPAISCADACAAAGLEPRGARRPRRAPPAGATTRGRSSATAPGVDALVAVFVPTLSTAAGDVAGALHDCSGGETTLLGAFMAQGDAELAALGGARPALPQPGRGRPGARPRRRATRAGGSARREEPPELGGVDADAAAAVIAGALMRGEGWLRAGRGRGAARRLRDRR